MLKRPMLGNPMRETCGVWLVDRKPQSPWLEQHWTDAVNQFDLNLD